MRISFAPGASPTMAMFEGLSGIYFMGRIAIPFNYVVNAIDSRHTGHDHITVYPHIGKTDIAHFNQS